MEIKLVLCIILVVFLFGFTFGYFLNKFSYKKALKKNEKLKNKNIAKRVKEKMEEMGSCPNEIDIVLNIINPKEFNRNAVPHCKKDCWNEDCACNKEHKI